MTLPRHHPRLARLKERTLGEENERTHRRLGIDPSRTQKRYDDRHLSEHGGKDKQKEAPRRNQKNYENTKRIFTFEVIKKEAVILPSY